LISKIFHVADVHIRLYKRHKEYEQVFKRFYDYVEKHKDENSVIVLAGDIVHNKVDMSPELIDVTSKFLRNCADILPTIVILGNHDMMTSNLNRLDALTPIIESLNHPNIHFWKNSGNYEFGDVNFGVFGFFDEPLNWPKPVENKLNVGLYHGPVQGSVTEMTTITSGITPDVFDGFQLVILGDIHAPQTIQKFRKNKPEIKYCGSLIQQNFGESVDNHGIVVWDLERGTSRFVKIKNDYGYYTFDVIDGKCDIPSNLPKYLRVRLRYENTTPEQLERFIKELSTKHTIIELIKQKNKNSNVVNVNNNNILGNSRLVEYQNRIITELLSDTNPSEINDVIALNNELNKKLPPLKANRNVIWQPIKLEFSNMFSYGEDNSIDFTNFNGSYGIFASNYAGKSSIFDILSFVIFDKSTRATKAGHILNNNKNTFRCYFEFELSGHHYFIERVGIKNEKTGAVKVDVNFWTLDESGDKLSLNGEDRDKTNFIIRDYVGSYDDFIMTSLSTQYDNQNFVEKSQRDRKELLYKFLDIFIYDELYKLAKEESKDFQVLIREFEKENLHQRSSELYNKIREYSQLVNSSEISLTTFKNEIKNLQDELVQLNKEFKPTYQEFDINEIEADILRVNQEMLNVFEQECSLKEEIRGYSQRKRQLQFEIQKLEPCSNLQEIQDGYNQIDKKVQEEKRKLDLLDRELKECKLKEQKLSLHKFDPNCKYCIDNEFVKDAYLAIEKIPELEQTKVSLLESLDIYNNTLNSAQLSLNLAKEYTLLVNELNEKDSKITLLNEQVKNYVLKQKALKSESKTLYKQRDKYNEFVEQITANDKIETQIEEVQVKIKGLEVEETSLKNKHRNYELSLAQFQREYDECNVKLDKYLDYVKKYRIYEIYLQLMSRDGIAYKILENVLPVIEYEVNQILGQIVDFTVRLEANDDKYINAFIVKDQNNSWPIELTSGMERFILALAFRTSLSEITTLPKSNFLAIDEGFGVLDSENILSMGKLFTFLKTQYTFLLVVSHIDSMKDLVDNGIKLDKINGFSKIKI